MNWKNVCGLGAILWSLSIPCLAQAPLSGAGQKQLPRVVQGLLVCERFIVPEGEEVWVLGDTEIRSSGPVRIDGMLRVVAPASGQGDEGATRASRQAPDLLINSQVGIWVAGVVQGADGAPGLMGLPTLQNCTEGGGAGGDLELRAPLLTIEGLIVGGDGGASGPNAKAARGGDVRIYGRCSSPRSVNRLDGRGRVRTTGLYGGNAGTHLGARSLTHEHPAGDGARGGHALQFPVGSSSRGVPAVPATAWYGNPTGQGVGAGGSQVVPFGTGRPGEPGTPGIGGTGKSGGSGAHGTADSPNGQAGGNGDAGTHGVGGNGRTGGDGRENCPAGPGGPGGLGGRGGLGVGGNGSNGGMGGNAFTDPVTGEYMGRGGRGGRGGDAGSGYGGIGGNGGSGGAPFGAGGHGGVKGEAAAGIPGLGGRSGLGRGNSVPDGWGGGAGVEIAGAKGATGAIGGPCHE